MKEIILIGGGGHCRACIDVIECSGQYRIKGILDTIENVGKTVFGYTILGTDDDIISYSSGNTCFLITIGQILNANKRKHLYSILTKIGCELPVIVSPTAYVGKNVSIGAGTIVMHHTVITTSAVIGVNCIINSKSLIEHDTVVGDHVHISTASVLNGSVFVGNNVFIGSGTVINNNIQIADDIVIASSSMVNRNLDTKGVYAGIPVKLVRYE